MGALKSSMIIIIILLVSRICRGFRGLSSDWRAESAVVGEACRLLVSSQDTVVAYLLATDVRLCCSASRRPTPTPVSPSVCVALHLAVRHRLRSVPASVLLCISQHLHHCALIRGLCFWKEKGCVCLSEQLSSSLGCRFFLTEFVREEVKRGRPVPRVNCVCGCRDH